MRAHADRAFPPRSAPCQVYLRHRVGRHDIRRNVMHQPHLGLWRFARRSHQEA